ncbi:hypothetical protein F4678DRAFT_451939 [Xylaria arbuscula]|nr:hypothetical protein F4678DRAFT_451939 [Xylaria arbuscula]
MKSRELFLFSCNVLFWSVARTRASCISSTEARKGSRDGFTLPHSTSPVPQRQLTTMPMSISQRLTTGRSTFKPQSVVSGQETKSNKRNIMSSYIVVPIYLASLLLGSLMI